MLQATLPEIKLALSSKSRDLLSHVISECMQMRGRIIKYIGCFGVELISNIHVAAHGSYITDRGRINPFAPEPPVTARADPCRFYPLCRHQF